MKKDNKKKKWRDVCFAKLLLKFTILQFKVALRFAILYFFYFNKQKRLTIISVGHFAVKWSNVVRNRWPG